MCTSPLGKPSEAPRFTHRSGTISLLVTLVLTSVLHGQSSPSPTTESKPQGEVVTLDPFQVTGKQTSRYQASDSTSGGRIATELFFSPQTINVVTGELLQDDAALRVFDGLKYIPGVTESTIPNGLDRLTIRGFQTNSRTVDGFLTFAEANFDAALVDRIEVAKGPSAILSPTGNPGGTVNIVSKKPLFHDQRSLTLTAGMFDANSIILDSTGPLSDKVAYRIVASYRNYDQYYDQAHTRNLAILPSLTYIIKPGTALTVEAQYERNSFTNYVGVPIDPSSGTNTTASLLHGISRKAGLYYGDILRQDNNQEYRAFFTTSFSPYLSTRVAARYQNGLIDATQENLSGSTGGAINPLTGVFTPGTSYGPGPTYTPTAAAAVSRTYTQGGFDQQIWTETVNIQNDWVYKRDFEAIKSTTSAGYAFVGQYPVGGLYTVSRPTTGPAINIDQISLEPFTYSGPTNVTQEVSIRQKQLYAQQSFTAFKDKINISGGLSRIEINQYVLNLLTNVNARATTSAKKVSPNYGVVFTPIPAVAVYYGHSANAVPVAADNSPPGTPAFSEGVQNEYGLRVRLQDDRLRFGLVYYDIAQTGVGVANPGNLAVPPPSPPLPQLITSNTSKGWEFETTYQISTELTVIANYANGKNRNAFKQPVRGAADSSGAVLLRYAFVHNSLKGLSVTVGANYSDRKPGDQASGLTAASTPTNLIANQPTFYIPARTLVDLSVSYSTKSWTAQVNVGNLMNKEYIAASLSRFAVWAGSGTNLRTSVTYKF